MSWTKATPYFRVTRRFGNFDAIINTDSLGLAPIAEKLSAPIVLKPLGLQGTDQWVEFANWLLEQARLYEEGPSDA